MGLFARLMKECVDDCIVIDHHVIGLVSEHLAGAAVGLALGLGMYGLGAVGSLAVVFTLHWLDLFERRLFAREKKRKKNAKKAETDEAPPQEEPAPPNAPEE